MKKSRRTTIGDLAAIGSQIPDESLRWVSGSADTKHIVMEPTFVYPMHSSCTYGDTRAGDYD